MIGEKQKRSSLYEGTASDDRGRRVHALEFFFVLVNLDDLGGGGWEVWISVMMRYYSILSQRWRLVRSSLRSEAGEPMDEDRITLLGHATTRTCRDQ